MIGDVQGDESKRQLFAGQESSVEEAERGADPLLAQIVAHLGDGVVVRQLPIEEVDTGVEHCMDLFRGVRCQGGLEFGDIDDPAVVGNELEAGASAKQQLVCFDAQGATKLMEEDPESVAADVGSNLGPHHFEEPIDGDGVTAGRKGSQQLGLVGREVDSFAADDGMAVGRQEADLTAVRLAGSGSFEGDLPRGVRMPLCFQRLCEQAKVVG